MIVAVKFNDRGLGQFAARLSQLADGGRAILASSLNEGGDALRALTVSAETSQTGLTAGTINRAQQAVHATGQLVYSIRAHGGDVRLKFFGPVEGGGGITAHPWNRSTFYRGGFMTSGRNGSRRMIAKLNGQVYQNIRGGKWGGKIRVMRSGLFIPTEMTRGRTAAAFEEGTAVLSTTIVARLGALLP